MITTKDSQLGQSLIDFIKEKCIITLEKKEHIELHLTEAQAKAGMFIPSKNKIIAFCPCGFVKFTEKRDEKYKLMELSVEGCNA